MDTNDYAELFDVEIDEGANEQELAGPAESTADAGEKEQEAAGPAGETAKKTNGSAGTAGNETDSETPAQPPEERARFAAARRKAEAERDAAIQKVREESQAEAQRMMDEIFRDSGLTNPYTGQPITSKAEYDAYRARFDEERRARVLKKSGLSDEEFAAFVNDLPEVRQAREAQQAAEAAARQMREAQAALRIEEELKEIRALDHNVQGLPDLVKMETYPKVCELVQKGYGLTDAFKLANYETLTRGAAEASRQAAVNAVQSKRHLAQTTTRGVGAATVPEDIKAAYHAFNPNASDAEIQQHYNKYLKE